MPFTAQPAAPLPRRRSVAWIVAVVMVLVLWAPLEAGTYHTVRQGQTLQSIARTYGVSASDLATANRLPASARLTPGSKLFVPTKAPAKSASAPAASKPAAPAASAAPANKPKSTPPAAATGGSSRPAPPPPTTKSAPLAAPKTVTVRPGESLWSIARAHGVEVAELAKSNGLKSNSALQVGQTLRLPVKGVAVRPASEVASAPPAPKADSRVEAPSVPGGGTSKPSVVTTTASRAGFQWPVQGKILRRFEKSPTSRHFGIDINVPRNTPVRAARDGVVVYAGDSISAYGRMVVVDHGGGWASCYAYNSRLLVSINDRVKRGEVIAESGDSGRGDQPFMHFQLRRNGDAVDPLPYLP